MTSWKTLALVLVLLAVGAGVCLTQQTAQPQEKKKAAKADAKKAATHTVEKKPFRIELSVKGILEPQETAEIVYRPLPAPTGPFGGPQMMGPLTVQTAVEHGANVKKGDVLVAFQTVRIDHLIGDLESEQRGLEASIKLAQEELPLLAKSLPSELAAAERAKKNSDEDLDYFLKVARPESEKRADFSVKGSQFQVEYAKEELRQLEKMYKANDLTEETEQIILKRQRHTLERAEFYLKQAVIERDFTVKVDLPRKEKTLRETATRQTLAYEKAKNTSAPLLNDKRQGLARMQHNLDKVSDRLVKARKDREGLTIKAPIEGVVYYGKFTKADWSSATAMAGRLVANGTVLADEVFMTIVKPRPVQIRLLVEESDVHLVKAGLTGKAHMTANPQQKLTARVTKVAAVPASPGKFEALVALDLGEGAANLMPGMACTVKFTPYAKKEAISVPQAAVFEEDDEHFVYVAEDSGKSTKRTVTPGLTSQGQTEIRQGLSEGERILLERPTAKKNAPSKGDES